MMSLVNNNIKLKIIDDQSGFAFTATATVISIILGLTILFMTNTARTESLRVAELYSAQSAYWESISNVQMAADMIINKGSSFIPTIIANFPNITITAITSNIYEISSTVTKGTTKGGAKRSASISISISTSNSFSMVEEAPVNGNLIFAPDSWLNGGNLYIGTSLLFGGGQIGQYSIVNFFLPTGATAYGHSLYNCTVTEIPQIYIPTFDHTAYNSLLNIASSITVQNVAQGIFYGNQDWPITTILTDINLQDINYVYGGIFVNGDLIIDGAGFNGIKIIDNNTAANPGFIVINGKVEIKNQRFQNSFGGIPDNVIIIALDEVKLHETNFGESINYAPNTWPNYVNEIYTKDELIFSGVSSTRNFFGQFNVFGDLTTGLSDFNEIRGIIYLPNSKYFGYGSSGRFDGTFYVKSTGFELFGGGNDNINIVAGAQLGRGISGGIDQSANNPWTISPGTFKEI